MMCRVSSGVIPPDRPSFDRDIRPLFRDSDVQEMLFVFDLASYDDVVEHGESIHDRLAEGSMPCDQEWPAGDVDLFRRWIDTGASP